MMLTYQWTQQASFQWTRIDMLLVLLDEIIRVLGELNDSCDQAAKRQNNQHDGAGSDDTHSWRRAELLVGALMSGVNLEAGTVAISCLRLYEFVHHVVHNRKREKLAAAIKVVQTIREGFQAVRQHAIELEREGAIPPLEVSLTCSLTA